MFPEDSGLLPSSMIILFASDLKHTFVLVCMLTQAMLKLAPLLEERFFCSGNLVQIKSRLNFL